MPTVSTRHTVGDAGPAIDGGRLFAALFQRALAASAVGATVAYVYLGFVAPPKPRPPESELLVFLSIAPIYFVVVVLVGYRISKRAFRPVELWLADARAASADERALVVGLPWRTAGLVGAGWLVAALLFGAQSATHHPAIFVAGVAAGILLAGLTTTGISFLLTERALRHLFALALAGESPSWPEPVAARALRARPRLLICWALGSGVALIAIAVAFLGRGGATGDELIGPVLFLVVTGLVAVASWSLRRPARCPTRWSESGRRSYASRRARWRSSW